MLSTFAKTAIVVIVGAIIFSFFVYHNNQFIRDCMASGKYERFECDMMLRMQSNPTNRYR